MRLFTLLFIFCIPFQLYAGKLLYNEQDLERLIQDKEYYEYFQHVKDIRPSQRNQKWSKSFNSMAISFCKTQAQTNNLTAKNWNILKNLMMEPSLANNTLLRKCQEQFYLSYLATKPKISLPTIKQFWKNSSHNPQLAYKLIKISIKHNLPLADSNMLQAVTHGAVATFYCRDQEIQKLLFSTILHNLEANTTTTLAQINLFINNDCLKQLKNKLVELLKTPDLALQQLAFNLLKRGNFLSKQAEVEYLFNYYLQTPVVGVPLNYAWNLISELGENYQHRMRLLNKLESYHFLPDELFVLPDVERRKALLTHLQQNFPEYFDLYFKQCLNYFQGIKSFPFGNPTLHCKDFISEKDAKSFVPLAYRYKLQQMRLGKL